MSSSAPYEDLSPDAVLDAVEAAGFETDGRLLALASYENRVYQVGIEGASPLVVKVYRPARWTDAAIAEEHAFALELAAAELPVVAPLEIDGHTMFEDAGYRYALYPRRGGRAPELESADHLQWMGRLRMAVLFSSAAYGITALLVQMFEVIVARHSLGVARPGWALLTFLVAMAVASLTWFLTRPVPREDP